ncbi:unnamed protein product [Schistosoma margrebowiei]|uniref:Uncharacterized protein n=1 Tax=Schistosoma margrebowiei TaxID=48269 RepID=A0A183N024_9TREM|nr:unnamed protein product [Schistosoma margrebowiei]
MITLNSHIPCEEALHVSHLSLDHERQITPIDVGTITGMESLPEIAENPEIFRTQNRLTRKTIREASQAAQVNGNYIRQTKSSVIRHRCANTANGKPITTSGKRYVYLNVGLRKPIHWSFVVVDVSMPIIGIDLLQHHSLLTDLFRHDSRWTKKYITDFVLRALDNMLISTGTEDSLERFINNYRSINALSEYLASKIIRSCLEESEDICAQVLSSSGGNDEATSSESIVFFAMPGEENSPDEDGPKYKISSFLFGNVNKEGQIEEYQHDVELKSINNLDRCHVREVEEAASDVLSDSSVIPSVSPEGGGVQPINNISSVDYYNEEETLTEEIVEKVLHDMKPEKIEEVSFVDDYDLIDSEPERRLTPKMDSDSRLLHKEGYASPGSETIVSVPEESSLSETNVIEVDSQLKREDTSSPHTESVSPSKPISYAQISVSEDTTLIMPPPLHPAPLSISRSNQIKPVYSRSSDSPITSPVTIGCNLESVKSPGYATTAPHHQDNALNTPLGSLMPPEYMNVDIKELFPSYDPGKTPLWGRLFKLPHQLGVYREFIEHYDYMEEILSQRPSRSDR